MAYPDGRVLKKVQASRGAGEVDHHRATGRSAGVGGERDQSEHHQAPRRKKKSTSRPVDKWVAKKPMPSLPNEMWDKILSHCDPSSLAAVCGVCKSMRRSALPHRTAFRIDAAKLDQGTHRRLVILFHSASHGGTVGLLLIELAAQTKLCANMLRQDKYWTR
jgi:hypothetical protein